jgi:hypothetical protein
MPNSYAARIATTATLAFSLALACGCNSKTSPTPENFTQAINTYLLAHTDCLLPEAPRFPFETSEPGKTKQLDSLVQSQLLTRATEPAIHASRYTVTPIGARFAPRFCYGHREVAQIVSFTPPAQANGFVETRVTYTYTMKDVPVWAKGAAVQAAFPAMANATSNGGTATLTLAQTMAGWQVPD